LGGGLAGAAMMAAPYMLAGQAISTVAGNVYQGAQNIQEVGGMAGQHFGSQFGAAGARGGQMGRGTVKQIVGVLHELVGGDVRSTMGDLKKLMDQAGQMGMLTGITDAQQFKSRFSKIVKQVRAVADVMGTSLSEAGGMMGQMRQMGLWSTADIMGTAMQARVAGGAAPQMMGAMQMGAQISHAAGGTLRAGAQMGGGAFRTLQAAQQAGTISEEDIMEFTGGVGGAQGKQMMAGRMSQLMSRFGQTGAGRLAMAGLGETEEGRFTGRISQERLQQFMGGQIGIGQLERMGRQQTGGRRGAMSFERFKEQLGQNLASEGGIEAFTQLTQEVAETRFGGSEDARQLLLQQMLGMSSREAELIGRLRDDLPRIRDRQARAHRDAVYRAFQAMDERQNRSWAGLMDRVRHSWGETVRPLQEFGESLATELGRASDDFTDQLMGRVNRIPMGTQERMRHLRQGALTTDVRATLRRAGGGALGQEFISQGGGIVSRAGDITRAMIDPSLGFGEAADLLTVNRRTQALRNVGLQEGGVGYGDVQLGGGQTTTAADMQTARDAAYRRAQGLKTKKLDTKEKQDAMNRVKSILKVIMTDPDQLDELKELKDKDPRGYANELSKRIRRSGGSAAMDLLREEGQGQGVSDLNTTADAQLSLGYGGGAHAADFTNIDPSLGFIKMGSRRQLAEAQGRAVKQMESLLGVSDPLQAVKEGMLAGGATGFATPVPGGTLFGAIGGGVTGLISSAVGGTGVEAGDIQTVMTGPHAEQVQKYLAGGDEQDFIDYVNKQGEAPGYDALERVRKAITGANKGVRDQLKQATSIFEELRRGEVGAEARETIKGIAQRALGGRDIGLTGDIARRYTKIVEQLRGEGGEFRGELEGAEYASATEQMEALAGDISDPATLRKMRRAGGFAAQIETLSRIGRMGAMDVGQTKKFMAGLRKRGIDVEQMGGPRLKELLKEGVEEGELAEVKEQLGVLAKSMISETRGGMKTTQQQMLDSMNQYADANYRFVTAVNHALGGKSGGELADAAKEMDKANKTGGAWTSAVGFIFGED
jgi:hypothetical protein